MCWWLKREHHKVICPKRCSALCLIASPSIEEGWPLTVCHVPETRTTLHGMPQWLSPCHCTVDECLGLWPAVNFLQVGKSIFLWCQWVLHLWTFCKLPQSLAWWELLEYFGPFPLLASEKPEGVAWEGSGTWKSLPSPSNMYWTSSRPYWTWAAYCISLPNHSLPCHWNTDLSSGCSVWEEHSQQSSLLISSKEPRRGTDLVFILYRAACAFPSFLEISFERADNARSILNSASED